MMAWNIYEVGDTVALGVTPASQWPADHRPRPLIRVFLPSPTPRHRYAVPTSKPQTFHRPQQPRHVLVSRTSYLSIAPLSDFRIHNTGHRCLSAVRPYTQFAVRSHDGIHLARARSLCTVLPTGRTIIMSDEQPKELQTNGTNDNNGVEQAAAAAAPEEQVKEDDRYNCFEPIGSRWWSRASRFSRHFSLTNPSAFPRFRRRRHCPRSTLVPSWHTASLLRKFHVTLTTLTYLEFHGAAPTNRCFRRFPSGHLRVEHCVLQLQTYYWKIHPLRFFV